MGLTGEDDGFANPYEGFNRVSTALAKHHARPSSNDAQRVAITEMKNIHEKRKGGGGGKGKGISGGRAKKGRRDGMDMEEG